MSKKVSRAALAAFALISTLNTAQANVIESFESGSWSAGWNGAATAGTVSTNAAHDGNFGVEMEGSTWAYNTSIAFTQGQTLSMWIRPSGNSSGRVYLGFGTDASGTDSFVAATNTGDIRFQHNSAFDFEELNTSTQAWGNHWYLATVTWNTNGTALGQLFDADGTTLLNSVTQSGLTRTGTGIALRGFGGFSVDTLSVSSVPEPSSLAMLLAGVAIAGTASVARRQRGA